MARVVFFLLLISGPLHAASFHPYFGWRTIDTEHFSVHYHNKLEETAQKAARLLEEAHAQLSPKYQWKPWDRTQVLLTDQNDDANGMASTLPYNWMLLRVAPPDPESSLALYDDWLKTLVTHEYTHILHLDAYGGFWRPFRWVFGKLVSPAGLTPPWIKEGTATLEETEETQGGRGRAAYSEMLIRTAVLLDKFPPIDRAAGVHWKWPSAQTPYIFGVKFLQWLEKKYGYEKLQQFHRKTQRSFFIGAVNKQAKKVFGKSFYRLWKDWQADLKSEYQGWEAQKAAEGFAELTPFLGGEDNFYLPTFSRDGKKLAYVRLNPRRAPRIVVRDLDSGKEKVVAQKVPSQMAFSPDGGALVFSTMARHARHYFYYDLYRVNLESKKPSVKRLTRGLRARDPDWHPANGQILFVASDAGTDRIKVYDVKSKAVRTLINRVEPYTQFAHPRYSPDGSKFAVVRFMPQEGWQVVVADAASGKIIQTIKSNGTSVFSRPVWTHDGGAVVYSSDQDGVANLYRFELVSGRSARLTNVRTGLFQPAISADGKLLARLYNGEGFEIVGVGPGTEKERQSTVHSQRSTVNSPQPALSHVEGSTVNGPSSPVRKYNPFRTPLFLPRFLAPGWYVLDNGLLVSLATAAHDPLGYHSWVGGGTYRTDAKHVGYFGRYTYNRFLPAFGVGIDDIAVDYGTLTFARTGNSYHFFEERRRGSVFLTLPLGKGHATSLSYFYEDRMPVTSILAAEAGDLNLGIFAGIQFNYFYGTAENFPASISPIEKGRSFRASATVTESRLGSNAANEQRILAGDYRDFFPLGKNHVLAFRVAGGAALGDQIFPGTFSLGGSLGEGALGGQYSARYYSLRGLPVGTLIRDRVMISSVEYRIPFVSPQRGLGTWPLFLNNLHLALFSDQGDAWTTTPNRFQDFFDNFFVSLGLETRADFVIGHGLPVTGRMGYAIVLVNRDRLGSLTDPFLGNRVRNGIFILQFGTSF